MAPENTVYLITGATGGIGRELVSRYLQRPASTVIATVRDKEHPNAKTLSTLPKDPSTTLILVKIDNRSETDAKDAVRTLETKYSLTHIDVVIANAGGVWTYPTVATVTTDQIMEHVKINTFGPLLLFQAVLPLLERAKNPRFIAISSSVASIGWMHLRAMPNAAYGPAKGMLNWYMRKIHLEHPNITSVPIDPGWVKTELGNSGAVRFGFVEAETSIEDSVNGLVKIVDTATREETSGRFLLFTGEDYQW